MIYKQNEELTHDSGMESYAQGASNDPIIKQIAESVCEKIRNGEYDEYSRVDEYGIYYLTDVSVDFPVGQDFNPAKDIDYDELDQEIDRALQDKGLTHYQTNGGVAPGEGDTEYIIHLADDRRPSVYWKEYDVPMEEERPEEPKTLTFNRIAEIICDKLEKGCFEVRSIFGKSKISAINLTVVNLHDEMTDEEYTNVMDGRQEDLFLFLRKELPRRGLAHYDYYGDSLVEGYAKYPGEDKPSAIAYFDDDRIPHAMFLNWETGELFDEEGHLLHFDEDRHFLYQDGD